MKKYESPTTECICVKIEIITATGPQVNPQRDGFDPSGGAMGNNSAIWDDTSQDEDAE